MNEAFLVQLITPEKVILSDYFTMAVVPGDQGDMGILAHHMPLITTLRSGLIKIYQNDTIVQQFYINGGFAHINNNECSVLADECLPMENLDSDTLTLKIQEKTKALEHARNEEERAALKRDLQFANLQLNLLNQSHQTKAM